MKIDGLEMMDMLPKKNIWHNYTQSSDLKTVNISVFKEWKKQYYRMGITDLPFYNLLGPNGTIQSSQVDDFKNLAESSLRRGRNMGIKINKSAARQSRALLENLFTDIPPIRYQIRYGTDWENSTFRVGSSCWWTMSYKNRFTASHSGDRTGAVILFAMKEESVDRHVNAWHNKLSRRKYLPKEYGPLGRLWIYPAEDGLLYCNLYDDFRNRSFTMEVVGNFIISLLKNESDINWQLSNSHTNRIGGLHINNGDYWFVTSDTVDNNGEAYNFSGDAKVNWRTIGNTFSCITDNKMVKMINIRSNPWRKQLYVPILDGESYISMGPLGEKYSKIWSKSSFDRIVGIRKMDFIFPASAYRKLDEDVMKMIRQFLTSNTPLSNILDSRSAKTEEDRDSLCLLLDSFASFCKTRLNEEYEKMLGPNHGVAIKELSDFIVTSMIGFDTEYKYPGDGLYRLFSVGSNYFQNKDSGVSVYSGMNRERPSLAMCFDILNSVDSIMSSWKSPLGLPESLLESFSGKRTETKYRLAIAVTNAVMDFYEHALSVLDLNTEDE